MEEKDTSGKTKREQAASLTCHYYLDGNIVLATDPSVLKLGGLDPPLRRPKDIFPEAICIIWKHIAFSAID